MGSVWLLLFVIGGLYLLIKGADHLVDGSSAIALRMGVSPLLIGLTLVAFGTSAPELATCLRAVALQADLPFGALAGPSQLALGNIVGSNICNLALVLGTAIALVRIAVDSSLVRRELPFLLALTLGFFVLVQTVGLPREAGIALLVAFLAFCAWTGRESIRQRRAAKESRDAAVDEVDVEALQLMDGWTATGLILVGLLILTTGAELLVLSAGALAERLHVPQEFIGLSIVALGTSLPELATVIVAARKGTLELGLGAVIGSNIFNIGLVAGLPAMLYGWPVDGPAILFDMGVMLALTVLVAIVALVRRGLGLRLGLVLLSSYAVYMGMLLMGVLQSRS